MKIQIIVILICICLTQVLLSQEGDGVVALNLPLRNSLTFNRYLINPTFSFVREQTKFISITNKREWVQFNDAPETYIANFGGRFAENIGAGISLFQQNIGVLTTFGGVLNFAYNAQIGRETNLTFGLNTGLYQSGINTSNIVSNFDDPSINNVPTNFLLTINPGVNFGTEFIDIGVSVQNLALFSFESSELLQDNPQQGLQAHLMYTGYIQTRGFFDNSKFSGLVRSEFYEDDTIISGLVMLTVPKGIWAQAGYNSVFGISGGIGLNITETIAAEYNYESAVGDISNFGPSHEITLAYRFKPNRRLDYSNDDEVAGLFSNSNGRKTSRRSSNNKTALSREERLAQQQARAERAAQQKAERDARAKAKVEAQLLAEEMARQEAKAQAEAKRLAEEQARQEAEAKAEAEVQRLAEEKARQEAEAKAQAEAQRAAEEKAKQEAEAKAQAEAQRAAEEKARREAEAKAQAEAQRAAEEKAKQEAEAEAQRLAEEKAKQEAEAKAQAEAERLAEEKAIQEAQAEAQRAAEERAKLEAEAKAEAEAQRLAEKNTANTSTEETVTSLTAAISNKQDVNQSVGDSIKTKNLSSSDIEILLEGSKDERKKTMLDITRTTNESSDEQDELLKQLDSMVLVKGADLKALKEENDLSEQGISVKPRPFKSITAENRQLAAITSNLENVIDSREQKIKELEDLYEETIIGDTLTNDVVMLYYRKEIKRLKSEQLKALETKADLDSQLESIRVATEFERRRRIKRAAFDNEEERYQQDRAALKNIKSITTNGNQEGDDMVFDFGEDQGSNIKILKNINYTEEGYYMILAVHSSTDKRDAFLRNVVAAGNNDVDFFYDVSTSKYYIYSKKLNNINEATKALEDKGNEAYNSKMSIVKIEN